MSNKLAGFNATSTANSQNSSNSRPVLREVVVDSSATAATAANDTVNNANNTAAIPDTGASPALWTKLMVEDQTTGTRSRCQQHEGIPQLYMNINIEEINSILMPSSGTQQKTAS
ncbi:hypothetical protein OS493_002109 [Desmophyllum pertusum]|uniref:Uncharacterized protein n=1 Tax=Desmophyllum pertusum TaxID=174260 RepID=A0A9X0CV30_9CNID|nr:hypothetical protein OS493_002109 [Desmophyllum pertusum]